MYDKLKMNIRQVVFLSDEELALIDEFFESKSLKRNEFLLAGGSVCHFISFIASGSLRHFHVKEGTEKTCDISFENAWVTDFQSFTNGTASAINLQAMEETTVLVIRRDNLLRLYKECPKYESFGRVMAEQVAQRSSEIAMSLSSDKPEERFTKLLDKQADLFQRVPQKYIANLLGISPESLSRIRSRIFKKQKS